MRILPKHQSQREALEFGIETAAAMLKARKGFRRLKAYKRLPIRAALIVRSEQTSNQLQDRNLDEQLKVA